MHPQVPQMKPLNGDFVLPKAFYSGGIGDFREEGFNVLTASSHFRRGFRNILVWCSRRDFYIIRKLYRKEVQKWDLDEIVRCFFGGLLSKDLEWTTAPRVSNLCIKMEGNDNNLCEVKKATLTRKRGISGRGFLLDERQERYEGGDKLWWIERYEGAWVLGM